MLAPAGSFKLKIQFWDGTYLPSFHKDNGDGTYGTTSFDDADTITITKTHTSSSPLANINFDLPGAPTGTIGGSVVDKDTGTFRVIGILLSYAVLKRSGANGDI